MTRSTSVDPAHIHIAYIRGPSSADPLGIVATVEIVLDFTGGLEGGDHHHCQWPHDQGCGSQGDQHLDERQA